MLEKLQRPFLNNDLAIKLGAANTLVLLKGHGIIVNEPSLVAIDCRTNEVRTAGIDARRILMRIPENVVATRLPKNGLLAYSDFYEAMLRYFIQKANIGEHLWMKPRVLLAVPYGIASDEAKKLKEIGGRAGASEVHLIEAPLAAALGIGLPVKASVGSMILDIGAGTTTAAIISQNRIVEGQSVSWAGDSMDNAIIMYLKQAYGLMIGERSAEKIKNEIGSASRLDQELRMAVKGRDRTDGQSKTMTVTSEDIREALKEPLGKIVELVRSTLNRCPPEWMPGLKKHGLYLTGGGALLRNVDRLLTAETGLPVIIGDDPSCDVINGCGICLKDPGIYAAIKKDFDR